MPSQKRPFTVQLKLSSGIATDKELIHLQMSMKVIIERFLELGVTVKMFTDPEEAMAWLEQQK
jgi:hypothetical protein